MPAYANTSVTACTVRVPRRHRPTWHLYLPIRNVYARTPPLIITLPVARAAVAMSCRVPASTPGALSAMQEVAESAPSGRNCFDLLENALLTVIARFLSAKELVRFAASCKRLASLEKECSELKHAQLCAHFTAAGAQDTVAWLTSNRGRVFSTFIVVTGAPYSVLKRLAEAPGHPPLLYSWEQHRRCWRGCHRGGAQGEQDADETDCL